MNPQEKHEIQTLVGLVSELRSTSSNAEKQKRLIYQMSNDPKSRAFLHKWLCLAYNPYVTFGVASERVLQMSTLTNLGAHDLSVEETLSRFAVRTLTGHAALGTWAFLTKALHPQTVAVLNGVLDKDLGIRLGVKTLNKVFKFLKLPPIPTFEIALGNSWKKKDKVWEREGERWYCSRKLDGVRCLAVIEGDKCTLLSRTGREFLTLAGLNAKLSGLKTGDCVLDMEIALKRADGADDFQGLMKQIRRGDYQISNIRAYVFDWIPLEDFRAGKSAIPFKARQKTLRKMLDSVDPKEDMLRRVAQIPIRKKSTFKKLKRKSAEFDWEGLMLRKDGPYVGKRSKDILKVKVFHDAEVRITGIKVGDFAVVRNGREETIKCMTRAVYEWKGNKDARVGSGFTIEQREEFMKHPERLIGSVVTIKYFQETKSSKTGLPAPRFPTVKTIHGHARVL